MKTKSKKYLKNKCDKLWSDIIKIKATGRCEVCGTPYNLNSHHVIGRVNYNLRWDLRNGICLCVKNHKFGIYSAHENPIWFMDWFKAHRPEDYEYLKDPKFNKFKTWYISDYEEILKDLQEWLRMNTN